jgi:hypothetical protein
MDTVILGNKNFDVIELTLLDMAFKAPSKTWQGG